MKKIISLLTSLSVTAACGAAVMAADRTKSEPDVLVDGSKIIFEDQNAVIVNGITLVPARGVFSAMGCDVKWNEVERTVKVTSSTGVRYVLITIDSDIMKICTYKSILTREDEDYTLEVPAQIINDRTMIPLRAVSEAFDCEVKWDDESYTVNITTGEDILLENTGLTPADGTATEAPVSTATPTEGTKPSGSGETEAAQPSDSTDSGSNTEISVEDRVSVSLSTDASGSIKAGDTFTVYVDVDNFIDSYYFSGITATFAYDSEKFAYVDGSGTLLNDNEAAVSADVSAENPNYEKGAKVMFITFKKNESRTENGHVFKAEFKSLNGESGDISLSNDYIAGYGYDTFVKFSKDVNGVTNDVTCKGKNIIVDTTPLLIGK